MCPYSIKKRSCTGSTREKPTGPYSFFTFSTYTFEVSIIQTRQRCHQLLHLHPEGWCDTDMGGFQGNQHLHGTKILGLQTPGPTALGMGKGPKRTLELVNYRLESRPLTDSCPQSLGLNLDSTQNRARPSHSMQ